MNVKGKHISRKLAYQELGWRPTGQSRILDRKSRNFEVWDRKFQKDIQKKRA